MNYLVNYQHIRSDFFLSGMNYPSQHIPVDYAPLSLHAMIGSAPCSTRIAFWGHWAKLHE